MAASGVDNSINEDIDSAVDLCKRIFVMRPYLDAKLSMERTVTLLSWPFQNTTFPLTDSVIFRALERGGPSFSSTFWPGCTKTDVVASDDIGDPRRLSEGEIDGSFVMLLSTHSSFTTEILCSTTEICPTFGLA